MNDYTAEDMEEAAEAMYAERVRNNPIHEAYQELPDCSCGWSGKGSGPDGQFMKGDRCPDCGERLF